MTTQLNSLKENLYLASARQEQLEKENINLIASDNLQPKWREFIRPYNGNMIQEGIIGDRPFAGARVHDEIENIANSIAKKIFDMDHAILQSHSCSQANQAVFHALLKPGDNVLSLQFNAGGHLTHGMRSNFSGRLYNFNFYGVKKDFTIDYCNLEKIALETKPKLIICGSSSYPWKYDIERLRYIADRVEAKLMLDLSHEAGLIAGMAFKCDVKLADVITMSLDKTMRGTHGAAILCQGNIAHLINKAVHPGTQSSFPIRRLTDAALALLETQTEIFQEYSLRTIRLSKKFADYFNEHVPNFVVGGSTDKHYLLLDTLGTYDIKGSTAEKFLEEIGILTNRQSLPTDSSVRFDDAGGIRLGTAWISSAGYEEDDVIKVAEIIHLRLSGLLSKKDSINAVNNLTKISRTKDVRTITQITFK